MSQRRKKGHRTGINTRRIFYEIFLQLTVLFFLSEGGQGQDPDIQERSLGEHDRGQGQGNQGRGQGNTQGTLNCLYFLMFVGL